MKHQASKHTASILLALTCLILCGLFCFTARTPSIVGAQTPKPTPTTSHQYVIACSVDDLPAEIRKANEAGYSVNLVSECFAADAKVVCVVSGDAGGEEDEGR